MIHTNVEKKVMKYVLDSQKWWFGSGWFRGIGNILGESVIFEYAWTYLQFPLRQWGAGNVYLSVLSSWKVNIAENPIAVMGLQIRSGHMNIKD